MGRAPGMSVRLKLTLSYAGFLMFAGALMLAAMWVFRYVPDAAIIAIGRFVPDLLRDPAPRAAAVLAFLLVFGLLGGWLLAGRGARVVVRMTVVAMEVKSGPPTGHWDPDSLTVSATQCQAQLQMTRG